MAATIRESILKGIATCPVRFTEADIEMLIKRLYTRNMEQPAKYAYVVARNWAVDKRRKEVRTERAKAMKLIDVERREQGRRDFEKARTEFFELVAHLTPTLTETQMKRLGMIRLVCFEGATDDECAKRFPGSNVVQRYQWKCRGIRMLRPHASPELLAVLNFRTWSKNQ